MQASYIFRVVITQMRRSKGYEVNLTSIGLTSGLDCLRGFLKVNVIKVSEVNLSYYQGYDTKVNS